MTYLNPYNTPPHWKKIIPVQKNRNARRYVKGMHPGKPTSLSIPLWLIVKKLLGPKAISKTVRTTARRIQVNDKLPIDDRAAVATGDTLQIDAKRYLLVIKKQDGRVGYSLESENPDQKMIVSLDKKRHGRVNLLNGCRKEVSAEEVQNLLPGSIWTPTGIKSPLEAKRIVMMTGRDKFNAYTIECVRIDDGKTILVLKDREIPLSWDDLGRRRYLITL